jgi:hypothetical protein
MSDGCGDCIDGGCDVGANGVVCVALMLGCSLVICVSFSLVASPCALRAHGGWRSVLVSWVRPLHPFASCSGVCRWQSMVVVHEMGR